MLMITEFDLWIWGFAEDRYALKGGAQLTLSASGIIKKAVPRAFSLQEPRKTRDPATQNLLPARNTLRQEICKRLNVYLTLTRPWSAGDQ